MAAHAVQREQAHLRIVRVRVRGKGRGRGNGRGRDKGRERVGGNYRGGVYSKEAEKPLLPKPPELAGAGADSKLAQPLEEAAGAASKSPKRSPVPGEGLGLGLGLGRG